MSKKILVPGAGIGQEIVRSDILVKVDDIIEFPVTHSAQRSGYIIYVSDKMVSINPEDVINIITE